MSGRKPKAEEVEVQETATEGTPLEVDLTSGEEEKTETDSPTAINAELALHIRDLVGLFFQQEIQALEQRITDLELLVGQPTGSVQFTEPPAQPVWDNYNPPAADDGVRWYQP